MIFNTEPTVGSFVTFQKRLGQNFDLYLANNSRGIHIANHMASQMKIFQPG